MPNRLPGFVETSNPREGRGLWRHEQVRDWSEGPWRAVRVRMAVSTQNSDDSGMNEVAAQPGERQESARNWMSTYEVDSDKRRDSRQREPLCEFKLENCGATGDKQGRVTSGNRHEGSHSVRGEQNASCERLQKVV